MVDPEKRKPRSFRSLIPNLVTVFVICAGMTSVRFGLDGRYGAALLLIVLAAILDAADGRIARYLDSVSDLGAELDSLADFFNFGIAPGLLVYIAIFDGSENPNVGWLGVLALSVCCALRLARFNVALDETDVPEWKSGFFSGIPAPALGCLALLPMFFLMLGVDSVKDHPNLIFFYLVAIALLAVSTLPTFSIKYIRVRPDYILPVVLASAATIVSLVVFPWETLIVGCFLYLSSLPFSARSYARHLKQEDTADEG